MSHSQRSGIGEPGRKVRLRAERDGEDRRDVWAYLDAEGNLHIDGQDLGSSTAPVSTDGEYEWFQRIQAIDVPRLIDLLGGSEGTDILDLLKAHWSGPKAGELERVLRESDIHVARHVWSG